jgi:hypothetical protein
MMMKVIIIFGMIKIKKIQAIINLLKINLKKIKIFIKVVEIKVHN